MSKPKLLVIEDDPALQTQLRWSLDAYEVLLAQDRASAIAQFRRHKPAVVSMDLGLPPDAEGAEEGLAVLQALRKLDPDAKIIVLTGSQTRSHALRAIALGAYDFQQKPLDAELLTLVIARAFHLHALQQELRDMQEASADTPLAGIVTRDQTMLQLCRSVEKLAPSSASVLLLGESGTGKELFARALHALSARKTQRCVAINCAAIPDHLLESELFGHEKGAFTGAVQQSKGKIEIAHGGSLLLDEVGDMPLPLQAKLLRFLQERVIERVGGREELAIDTRVIASTHRDLQALVKEGRFREDLYYRLCAVSLRIPALRERAGDAVLLAQHFRKRLCAQEGRATLTLSEAAISALAAHSWPGNVRELENCLRRAVLLAEGNQIEAADLGLGLGADQDLDLRRAREGAEYAVVTQALAHTNGNIARAAELLGVSRPSLYDLLGQHGIKA